MSATMVVFWTVAEGWILIALRWGFIRLRNRQENSDLSLASLAAVALVAVFLALGREWLVSYDTLHLDTHKLYFYRVFTWNLFCTLWVVLEALIALYSWRIYMILTGYGTVMPKNRNAIFTLVIASCGFFLCYHYITWDVIVSSEIGPQQIVNIGAFYIRLCGVLWILIESFIAILGFRTVRILSQPDTAEV